jgi:Tol biopolymer transport system component
MWSGEIAGDLRTFTYSTPSPDGRYLSAVDWSSGDLAVWDLETGERRRVSNKGRPWSQSQDWAWSSVFSPDGSQLAYMWFVTKKGYEVRIIGVDGSGQRTVFDQPCWPRCRLEDWSEDGEQLLALIGAEDVSREVGHQETWQLMTISVSDGSHRVLKSFEHHAPQLAGFSVDSRWVAYDLPSDRETGDRDVHLLSLDGGEETPLLTGPEDDRFWGWLPDGQGILFYSDRQSARGVWRLPVKDGRAVGDAVPVRQDLWKVWPLGFSSDRYYYGVVLDEASLQIASFDVEAGGIVGLPEPAGDPTAGSPRDLAWSLDGQYLAYRLRRHPNLAYQSEQPGSTGDQLVLRSLASDEVRALDLPLEEWERIRWVADGSAVFVAGTDAQRNVGVFRLDLNTGELESQYVQEQGREEAFNGYAVSPDGKTLYFSREGDPENPLIALDLTTGEEMVLTAFSRDLPSLAVSPDGQWLNYVAWSAEQPDRRALTVVSTTSGEPRELHWEPAAGIRFAWWTPDSDQLIFPTWNEQTDRITHWTISREGGPPHKIGEAGGFYGGSEEEFPWGSFELNPDGSRVAGVSLLARGEIWVIENVLGKACANSGS